MPPISQTCSCTPQFGSGSMTPMSPGMMPPAAGPEAFQAQMQQMMQMLQLMVGLFQMAGGQSPFGSGTDPMAFANMPAGFGNAGGQSPNGSGLGSFLGGSTGSSVAPTSGAAAPSSGGGSGSGAVGWAESQLGVSESGNPDVVRGYSNGRTQSWCADFVSKAFENTGGSPFGHQSSVQGILNWGRENGRFITDEQAESNPQSVREGDIAVWKESGRSHVGLVTGVSGQTFQTIEGNTSDRVARRSHSLGENGLTGFVRAR